MAVVTLVRVTGEPFAVPPPAGKVQTKLEPVAVRVNVFPEHKGVGLALTLVGGDGNAGLLK